MRDKRIGLLVVLVCLASLPAVAQTWIATGPQQFGTFQNTNFETTNLGDLNMHFEVPIFSRSGSGTPFSFSLGYDSSVWGIGTVNGASAWVPHPGWGFSAITQPALGFITYQMPSFGECAYPNGLNYFIVVGGFAYQDQFGATHSFSGAVSDQEENSCSTGNLPSALGPLTASDGSGYTLKLSLTNSPNSNQSQIPQFSGVQLFDKTGTFINAAFVPLGTGFSGGYSESATDRNGNVVTATSNGSTTTFTDTLHSTALTVTGAGTPSSPLMYTYPNPVGGTSVYEVNFTTQNVKTSFACNGQVYPAVTDYGGANGIPANLVSSIVLPDNTRYTIGYEPNGAGFTTGRIASVVLPTGATISWVYKAIPLGGASSINCGNGRPWEVQRTAPDGNWMYSWSAGAYVSDLQGNATSVNFEGYTPSGGSRNFYETSRSATNAGSSTVLQTVNTCYNGNTGSNCPGTITGPINEIAKTTILPTGNLQSEVDTTLDQNGDPLVVKEYDNGSGAAGALLRETTYQYYLGSFPSSIQVFDGSLTKYAETDYGYDDYTDYPLKPSGAAGLVAVTNSMRANATQIKTYTSGGSTLISHYQYFDTGNVYQSTDVNGAITTMAYGQCNDALLSSLSHPVAAAGSQTYTWNCAGGVQLTTVDENSQIWTTGYSDPNFWRPTSVADPTTANTSYAYTIYTSPSAPAAVESTLNFNSGASTADVRVTLDGLGRGVITQVKQSPSATNYDSVSNAFDADSRPSQVSMPYSAAAGSTTGSSGNTTVLYDALNRPVSVTDGGGGWTTYTYQGNNDVLVTVGPAASGENTKQRQLEYDGLGRISSVCEITSAGSVMGTTPGSCNQSTAQTGFFTVYGYNPLNQVTAVVQNVQTGGGGTQTRIYGFDFLGREISSADPESGTVQYIFDTDPTCGTSNGDLVKRFDAIANVTCYSYDAMHRLTSVTYPSGPYSASTITPPKYYTYDSASVSGFALAYPKNRLVEAYTGTAKTTDAVFSYTSRGEASDTYTTSPHTGATYHHLSATYWANGLPNVFSGNTAGVPSITNVPDGEGRISKMTAASGQNPVTAATYNTSSQVTNVTLGSTDTQTFGFDPNTGRPTSYSFRVDAKTETGTITNNTNGTIQKLAIVDPFIGADTQTCTFTYDDLNRLSNDNCGSVWGAAYGFDAFGNISKSTIAGSPGTTFQPTFNLATNRFSSIPGTTPTYDGNGNLTADGFHTYGWDADGNLIAVDGVSGVFDALDRRAEVGSSGNDQMLYPPFALTHPIGLASGLTAAGVRIPMPGGGEAIYTSTGLNNYRHPNWQGSQVLLSYPTETAPNVGSAFTPFGEKYSIYPAGFNGYFAGMLGIADDGSISDAYQAEARLLQQAAGRWISPDPAGLSAVDLSNPQSLNRYAYVMNNPLNNIDPSGLGPNGSNGACPAGTTPGPGGDGCVAVSINPSTTGFSLDVCGTLMAWFPGLAIPGCASANPNTQSVVSSGGSAVQGRSSCTDPSARGLSFGGSVSASAYLGLGKGIGGTASLSGGFFHADGDHYGSGNSLAVTATTGGFTLTQSNRENLAIGGAAGLSAGGYLTNAGNGNSQAGTGHSTQISFSYFTIQFDTSGSVWSIGASLSPSPTKFGVLALNTKTKVLASICGDPF